MMNELMPRVFELHTVWTDGRAQGGTSFYFIVEDWVPYGAEAEHIKNAAKEFLLTPEGKRENEINCRGSFGWGDVYSIPDAILELHGLKKMAYNVKNSITVDHDEAFQIE